MYDSLNRLRSIIRLPIHKDNNDMVNTIDMNDTNEIYKYKLYDIHYKGISTLQRYFGKKLNTSNDENPQETEHKLKWLAEVKKGQYYTTQQKIYLNNLRAEYILDKK